MYDNTLEFPGKETCQPTYSTVAAQCLEAVSESAPVLERTLAQYGNVTLAEYLETLKPSVGTPLQSREDFLDIYRQEVVSLLGETAGAKAVEDVNSCPMVLTANHLGVDFFSQSVQTSLLFYILKRRQTASPVILPVIACGSVPLDNVTYPLGILLYNLKNGAYDMVPRKLPVFSNKVRRRLVTIAPPFDRGMVDRAMKRLGKMEGNSEIGIREAGALRQIFEQDYDAPGVMDLCSYSKQSLVVNNRIWQRLFSSKRGESHIVTMDMENIVRQLLVSDLNNKKSLIFSLFMDPGLRNRVIEKLDNKRACWNLAELRQRHDVESTNVPGKTMPISCGTLFFWGVNERSRRIPLLLVENKKDSWSFKGTDDKGNVTEITFSVESILTALKSGQLLPSIFTSFTVLAFARGLTCLGGYYQAEYLPMMQKELVAALRENGSYQEEARLVEQVETGSYLSGMQTVMTGDTDSLVPAGPIEIIAGGGLTDEDLDQILSLSVREAHLASLFETVADISSSADKNGELKQTIAKYCWSLRDKVVVI